MLWILCMPAGHRPLKVAPSVNRRVGSCAAAALTLIQKRSSDARTIDSVLCLFVGVNPRAATLHTLVVNLSERFKGSLRHHLMTYWHQRLTAENVNPPQIFFLTVLAWLHSEKGWLCFWLHSILRTTLKKFLTAVLKVQNVLTKVMVLPTFIWLFVRKITPKVHRF